MENTYFSKAMRFAAMLLLLPSVVLGQIGYSSSNGFSFANPVYSTSSSIGAPQSSELATAGWVRSLFDGAGVSYYATTNINNTFTNAGIVTTNTQIYELSTTIPAHGLRTYIAPTNGAYIGSVVTTNQFQQLNSSVVVNAYLEAVNGGGTAGPTVKPEIYISYDKTNWLGDWDAAVQNIPEGATNLQSWVISNPTYTSTNATGFYVQRRFKIVTQTTPASDVIFHLGTNTPSHIALSGASLDSGNAYLAANQTFTGTNTFSTWLAGNGGGLTNIQATNIVGASFYPFDLNVNATGTNIYISPTNGNLQQYAFTNTAFFTVLDWNTNYTETIRLELRGSNTLTWATANLSNSASLGPSNAISVILLDRPSGTNLWWGYRLR